MTTATKAQRTPGPWRIEYIEGRGSLKISTDDGEYISDLALSRYVDDRDDPEAMANAAFIVTACNAYEPSSPA